MRAEQPNPWQTGYEGAVSLAFDDGMQSQLDKAIPLLAQNSLCGTFYVNPGGPNWRERLMPWIAVAEAGHEIGNHTGNHP